ncbi:extracellular matrix organizing protein FRAS1-like [Saccostrea echinata]|uniref:extracellular matrix organizing protein FRAS1-like n=1 Tax=Saccostrea echinata TaxID=191078 RepID=UPI002A80EAEE|nr:extracellular matrix organizing protein FRAS1-like [Saccostrea echinata]
MRGFLISICTVMSLLVQKLAADCQHMDKFYMNHTLWLPDLCTICTCLDPVSVCENVRCLNPNCFYAKGEYLQIPHDGCCPECVGTLAPCRQDSKTFAHNTDWYPDPCSHCTCWDGDVTCSAVACPRQNCKPGTVAQTLPGQCCPQCIASGSSCLVDGVTYDDGHEWSPLPCTKCVCQDGTASCFPIQCPPLVCPPGQYIERGPHSCCPVCKSKMCSDRIKQYQNNESWQKDECTFCTCLQGETVCRKEECVDPKELECGKSERKVRRPGECCIECVSRQDSCKSEIPIRYHGDVWNISACEFCLCENGQVHCHKAMCEPLICELYETKVHLYGKCCPECMEQPRCYSNGEIYLDGDTWYPDPCSICSCKEGHITCYHKPCPVCPQGQMSLIHSGECCGTCKPLQCSEACSVCRPDDPDFCLVCKQPGLYLQDGTCVTSCQENFYVTRNRKCGECHEMCASCTGATQHHCVKCKPGLLWRDGQCVPRCGSNFYQNGGQCLACHSSCRECLGPNKDNCLSCTISVQVLLSGRCVNDCGPQFYVKDGKCTSCQPTCSSCSSDGRFCTNCTQSLVLHKGQCVTSCPWGYFISPQGVCTACHPSCKKCSGPHEEDCLTCLDGSPPRKGGHCPGNCVNGEYRDTNGNCKKCEPGCIRCRATENGQGSVCVECPTPMMAFDNICVRQCPIGHFNQSSICQKCSSGCVECISPSQCTRCGPSLLLSAGVCVLHCHPTQVIDSLHSVCQDCPSNCLSCSTPDECMQCDDVTYLKMGVCVSACGQGFYQNPDARQCTANQHRPTLQIIGQIRVEQGGVASITGDTFSLSDSDTSKDDLHLIVTEPTSIGKLLKAVQGNDGILNAGGTFSLADLETGKIRFIQNVGNERKGKIKLRVTDGQLYSEERALHILVIPKNPPYLRKHESLLAFLENTTAIGPQQVDIRVDSLQNSVSITVLQGPSHGQIVNREHDVPVSEVTLKDWTNEKLAFKIGKSKATSDRVLFQVFDGYHSLNFLLDITIRKQVNTGEGFFYDA